MIHLPNKLYDILKWFALIVVPASGTLYLSLGQIWGFEFGLQVVATCNAVSLFIGVLIGISQINFNATTNISLERK